MVAKHFVRILALGLPLLKLTLLSGQTLNESFENNVLTKKHALISTQMPRPKFASPLMSLKAIVPDFQVSEEAGGVEQTVPWLDRLGDFGYVMIWWDNRRAPNEIWAQLLNRDGRKIGKNFPLVEHVRNIITESRLRVDANATGDFVVVWSSGYPRYDRPNIYARRFAADGMPRGEAIPVTQDNGPVHINPDVLLNDDGSFVCLWQNTTLSFGASTILARWFDAYGNPLSGALEIVSSSASNIHATVAGSGKGEAVIALAGDDRTNGKISVEKRDVSGNLLSGPAVVNESTGAAFSPAIQVEPNGDFVVAWTRYRLFEQPSAFDTFVRFFDMNMTAQTPEIRLNELEGLAGYYFDAVSVDYFTDGSAFIVWQDQRDGQSEIWGQHLTPNGDKIGANRKLNDETPAIKPVVSLLASQGIVAWQDSRRIHADIFMRKLTFNRDSVFSPSELVNDDHDDAQQSWPKITVNSSGEIVIAWLDARHGYFSPYLQRLQKTAQFFGANEDVVPGSRTVLGGPTLGFNESGDIIVGYSAFCAFASPSYARVLNFYQQTDYNPFLIAGTCDLGASPAEFVLREDKNFIATWRGNRPFQRPGSKNAWDVFARFFKLSGESSSEIVYVNSDTTAGYHGSPDIAGDPDGNFLIVWGDPRDGGRSIYAQLFNAVGKPCGANFRVSQDHNVDPASNVAVAMDTAGNATIAWVRAAGDTHTVWARRFNQQQQTLDIPVQVNAQIEASSLTRLDVEMSQDGRAVVVADFYDGEQWKIFGQRFDVSGRPLGENFRVGSPPPGTNQINPQAALRQNWLYVTWEDDRDAEFAGNYDIWATILDFDQPTAIAFEHAIDLPNNFVLKGNYPNPFNSTTTIHYAVPRVSHVKVRVFNLLGIEVRTLVDAVQIPGEYKLVWDGRNNQGFDAVSSVYLVMMQAGSVTKAIKAVLMR